MFPLPSKTSTVLLRDDDHSPYFSLQSEQQKSGGGSYFFPSVYCILSCACKFALEEVPHKPLVNLSKATFLSFLSNSVLSRCGNLYLLFSFSSPSLLSLLQMVTKRWGLCRLPLRVGRCSIRRAFHTVLFMLISLFSTCIQIGQILNAEVYLSRTMVFSSQLLSLFACDTPIFGKFFFGAVLFCWTRGWSTWVVERKMTVAGEREQSTISGRSTWLFDVCVVAWLKEGQNGLFWTGGRVRGCDFEPAIQQGPN